MSELKPTADERREVAARLRKHEPTSCLRGALGAWLACEHYDCCEDCSRHASMMLADLIEPEERTCRNDSESGFHCSACAFGDFGGFHGHEPNYCPNCGAKVVE